MKWFMNYIALGEAQVEHNLKICVPGWKTFTTDSHDVWSHSLRDQILSDSSEPLVALVSTCGHLKMRLHLIRAYLGLVSAIYCYSLRGRQLSWSQRFSSAARRQERREREEVSFFSPLLSLSSLLVSSRFAYRRFAALLLENLWHQGKSSVDWLRVCAGA